MAIRRFRDRRWNLYYITKVSAATEVYQAVRRTPSGREKDWPCCPIGNTAGEVQSNLDRAAMAIGLTEDLSCPSCGGVIENQVNPQHGRYSIGCGSNQLLNFNTQEIAQEYIDCNCTGQGRLGCSLFLKATLSTAGVKFREDSNLKQLWEEVAEGMAKNTYHCACGKTFEKSTNSESTGYRMDDYSPTHECYGCPFVLPITDGWGENATIKTYECRASLAPIKYETCTSMDPSNTNVAHIHTLNFIWLESFIRAYLAEPGAEAARLDTDQQQDFSLLEKYFRNADLKSGRRCYAFTFMTNAKGKKSKAALFDLFFDEKKIAKEPSCREGMARQAVLDQISVAKKLVQLPALPPPGECPYYKGIEKSYSPRGYYIDCELRSGVNRTIYDLKGWAQDQAKKGCLDPDQYVTCLFYSKKMKEESQLPMTYIEPSETTCPCYLGAKEKKGGGHLIQCGQWESPCPDDGSFISRMAMCKGEQKENCRFYLLYWFKEHGREEMAAGKSDRELRNIYDGFMMKKEQKEAPSAVMALADEVRGELKTVRTMADITAEIRWYKAQTVQNIIEIGKRLNEAKEQLDHGQWGVWLKNEVDFSQQTASNFMRIAREYSNYQAPGNLTYTKALALLSIPEGDRNEFVEVTHIVDGQEKTVAEMSSRELDKVIKERDEALRAAKINENIALKRRDELELKEREIRTLRSENTSQQKEIERLEKRPIDVAVAEPSQEQLGSIRDEIRRQMEAEAQSKNTYLTRRRVERADVDFTETIDGAVCLFLGAAGDMDGQTACKLLDICISYLRGQAEELAKQKNMLMLTEREKNPGAGDIDF